MTTSQHERANTYHLVMDVAWFGVAFAATSRFLQIYAIHMDASAMELTLLTALPAMALFIASLFGTRWRHQFSDTVKALILPSFAMRFSFLLPVFTPLFPSDYQIPWLIFSVALPAFPNGIAFVIFWGIFRESLNDHKITPVFGWRTAALNLALGLAVVFFGFCLEHLPYPLNYQVIFGCAFAASMISMWHLTRIKTEPDLVERARPRSSAVIPVGIWQNRRFWDVAWLTLLTHIAFFAVFPLVPLWLANELGASERFLIEFGLLELVAGAAVSMLAPRLIDRFNNKWLISMAMLFTGIALGIIVVAPSLSIAILAALLIGGGWTVTNLSLQSLFIRSAPEDRVTSYSTIFSQIIFLSTAVAPFLGSALSDAGIPLANVLLFGLMLRVLISGVVAIQAMYPIRRYVYS